LNRALPHTVVINLDRDTARLAHMQRELDRAGVPFVRFPAVRGAELPGALAEYFDAACVLTPGEIGCYASHLRICQLIASGGYPSPTLVLEDDLGLCEKLADILRALPDALPANWDMVRLANAAKHAVLDIASLPHGHKLVRYSRVPTSTGASLVSRSGAEKFLKRVPRNLPIDQDLRRVWTWGLDMYGVEPIPIVRDVFEYSSIDAAAKPGHRRNRQRIAIMRRARAMETPERMRFALQEIGLGALLDLEFANALRAITPKRLRRAVRHVWHNDITKWQKQ
jgi:glycosyl transferase family 25